jgi:hypothetical protein
MTQFGSGHISSRSAGADLHYPATLSPIGLRRSDNCWPTLVAELRKHQQQTMENALAKLAQALRQRLAIIHDEESRRDHVKHMDRLRAVSEKIDRLQESLTPSIDPRLKHYLDRKSYDKALEHLEAQL